MKRHLGILVFAVSILLTVASAAVATATSAREMPALDEAKTPTLDDTDGIPPDIMEAQAILSDLAELVEDTDVNRQIATVGNEHKERRLVVYVSGEPPRAMVDLADGQLPPQFDGYGIDLRRADYSMDEMQEAMRRAADTMTQEGFPNHIAVMIPQTDGSGLTLELDPKAVGKINPTDLEPKYTEAVGMPVEVVEGATPVPLVHRGDDAAPWRGGAGVKLPLNGSGGSCSTGFSVLLPGGYGRILSAAHCDYYGNEVWYDLSGDQYTLGGPSVAVDGVPYDTLLIDPIGSTNSRNT